MNIKGNLAEIDMPDCSHLETNTRIIIHVLSCLQCRDAVVYICTNDTDVVFLLTAYVPDFFRTSCNAKTVAQYGVGLRLYYLSINTIADCVRLERCKELLLFILCQDVITPQAFLILIKSAFGIAGWFGEYISNTLLKFSDCPDLPLSEDDISVISL